MPLRPCIWLFCSLLFAILEVQAFGQSGIKGQIGDENGNPIAFASVYVKETQTGTITNRHGEYQLHLPKGNYTIKYQHLGYKSEKKQIAVDEQLRTVNIKLAAQALQLPAFIVSSGDEDPAYAIIRKAVAAAKYYRLVIKSYQARAYVKTFTTMEVPGYMRKLSELEEEDTTGYFVRETVLKTHYIAPNTWKTHIISTRNNDQDTNQLMNDFVIKTIYDPDFMGGVSPLSAKTFRYYKFRLENTFIEGDNLIHKIKVTPKAKSKLTFRGKLYIVEGSWGVHSFSLSTLAYPGEVTLKQVFAPIDNTIWFPVNHNYQLEGNLFGLDISSQYLASLSNYNIKLDTELAYNIKSEAAQIDTTGLGDLNNAKTNNEDSTAFSEINFKSLKDFNKAVKKIKKELKKKQRKEEKTQQEPAASFIASKTVDSTAFERDSAYWEQVRPIPLSKEEKTTGLMKKLYDEEESDTIKSPEVDTTGSGIFQSIYSTIITGRRQFLGKKLYLHLGSLVTNTKFNTVEGLALELPATLTFLPERKYELSANIRYGINSKKLYWKTGLNKDYDIDSWQTNTISIKGGKYISQFNDNEPIATFTNTLYTLFLRQNHAKFYEKEFVLLEGKKQLSPKILLNGSSEYARRRSLHNQSNYSFFYKDKKDFTSNLPKNIEQKEISIKNEEAFIVKAALTYRPTQKFMKRNGHLTLIRSAYPIIRIKYSGAIPGIFNTRPDWHRIEADFEHQSQGVFLGYGIRINAGNTFAKKDISFTDFKHFNGNQTLFQKSNSLEAFRLLDYYNYSTSGAWLNVKSIVKPNKFLFSQFPAVSLLGFSEYLCLNYLRTEYSPNYWEAGYGLGYVQNQMALEAFTSWDELSFQGFGIRLRLELGI
ncbi:MAG: DUF5686 and carboxypeptidase regulatory-like domain-containing protein [Bacteroidales bacterium]|nr:DUF5686 and carboxypeptidase regulatory-like domain-containing protein [Bacteroidales bacterium]